MQYLITLIGIITSTAFYMGADYRLLNEAKVKTVKKISKGLRPMSPMVEKYNGNKSSLFEEVPYDELASSLK